MIRVYCDGEEKFSFFGSHFRYAIEQDSTDKNGTKITAVNNNGDKTRLALYSDVLRNITQMVILPTPSKENLGKVYQYIGNTNVDYSKGSFYECISDGEETPTYSWRELGSGGSITIKDVNELPTTNIENIIYRLTSVFSTVFNQSPDQMILASEGFTYTEDTVDGVLTREWTTDLEVYVKIGSEYKRVNKIIYKFSDELHCYHKIMYNDEVLHEATEYDAFTVFYFKITPVYYAGDTINQKTERLAKYDDVPDVSKKPNTFTGTQFEWNALTVDEKAMYTIVNIIDDTNPNDKFIDITSQCIVALGTAKVMKCGQIVVINGYVPKVSGSNGFRDIITKAPVPISNGTTNSALGTALNSATQSARITDSKLRVYCSTATETTYSIIYLTDE